MTSLADELLNDFEDDAGAEIEAGAGAEGDAKPQDSDKSGNVAANDEERDNDETMDNVNETEKTEGESAKDKIEKMHFAEVGDVRSVARLMKTLEPVLNVCILPALLGFVHFLLL